MLDRSLTATGALVALSITVIGAQAHDEAKYPDLSGQWMRNYPGNPRYDPSKPPRQQEAPLKPEYQVRFLASLAEQDSGSQTLNPAYTCLPQGMPRMMSGVVGMEFLISPSATHILFDNNEFAPRRIYTDGRPWPQTDQTWFTGYSIGKWLDTDGDGRYDTLEAETRKIRGPRVWDNSGMPMADDEEAIITERFYLDKNDPSILHNDITTTDNSLTRPWSAMKAYKRLDKIWWTEANCAEGQAHVTIGKEHYFLSGDGTIMPTRKDQLPPDLRYFRQPPK
jgi:hypothetical protein